MFVFCSPNLVWKSNFIKTTFYIQHGLWNLGSKQQPQVKSICKGLHPRVFSQRALEHYCVAVTLRWSGICWGKKRTLPNRGSLTILGLHTVGWNRSWEFSRSPKRLGPNISGYINRYRYGFRYRYRYRYRFRFRYRYMNIDFWVVCTYTNYIYLYLYKYICHTHVYP